MSDTPVPRIEATNLSELDDIRHAFFTRKGGVSGGIYGSLNVGFGSKDNTENVAENRRRAMASINRDAAALHTVFQVHGRAVIHVRNDDWDPKAAPEADAMVTNEPGHV
ncbi:MAG: laccase domain-containing protein, partial [Pseudomonadota bacterium]|nr:laccase domain-containing protein [Pseudomonadota bacterium]